MSFQLEENKIKKLQAMDVVDKSIIDYMNGNDIKSHLDFTMNSQDILFEMVKDHDEILYVLAVPKPL